MNLKEIVGAIGEAVGFGAWLRARYAAVHGRCRRCEAPLGGTSPSRICEPCHADVLLGAPCVCDPRVAQGKRCGMCGGKG